jgi:acyl-CoA thioesterase-1
MIAPTIRSRPLSRRMMQIGVFAAIFHCALAIIAGAPLRAEKSTSPVRIVAFGDSLTAGFRLGPGEAFPVKLQQALAARGHNVEVANAGVSGDTTAGGLARLDWAVPDGSQIVILELGANDALRGLDPAASRRNLDAIITRLKAKGAAVLLAGMHAPRNWGEDYVRRFDAIFPELAKTHGLSLYPFFLEGVALRPELNLDDGMHPNARGVDVIVAGILPHVEKLVEAVGKKAHTR